MLSNRNRPLYLLAIQSFGVLYGDLSISPIYVYQSIFSGNSHSHLSEDAIFGAFSLIFWSFTLLSLFKYIIITLSADDNGEGGTICLYALLCRQARLCLLPNYQASDEEISTYYNDSGSTLNRNVLSSPFRIFIEKHKKTRTCLLILVLFGACMVICGGALTPSMSVLSSIEGLQVQSEKLHEKGTVVVIACAVLVGLFVMQHRGTDKVAFLFSPIVLFWLLSISVTGIYNIIECNPRVYRALSPYYIYKFFKIMGRNGWLSLGGVLLCITGTELIFSELGHFSTASIRVAFCGVVYPCLVLQYMGQAAFLSKNISLIHRSFYASIPGSFYWPVFALSILAAIVSSQAVISATFSIVKQCHALSCFPRVKLVHRSRWIQGQIYIPEINWILMVLCLSVTVGFQDTTPIGNAYGLACMTLAFVTTWLMSLVIFFVWHAGMLAALSFLAFFGSMELLYLSSSIMKIPHGGWVSLALSAVFMVVMYGWHYGTRRKYLCDLQNKVSMKWIMALGPSLGIMRIPGIGIIYTDLVTGVPSIFSHFMTNLPAMHQVVIFISVKSVPVPYVPYKERYLVGRVGPKPFRLYRCIVRYGYNDVLTQEDVSEDTVVMSIAEFIQLEREGCGQGLDGKMAVVRTSMKFGTRLVMWRSSEDEPSPSSDGGSCSGTNVNLNSNPNPVSGKSPALQSLQASYEQELPELRSRQRESLRCKVPETGGYVDAGVRGELAEVVEARQAGVTYVLGHSRVKAKRSSASVKKVAIDVVYSFLRKNCRAPPVALHIPHISLIAVGLNYYV